MVKKRKISVLSICIALAAVFFALGIGYFVHILSLKTSYKNARRDLTACYTDVYHGGFCQASRREEVLEDAAGFADWLLLRFMTQGDTVPIRKEIRKTDTPQTITVTMRDAAIYASPAEQPYYTNLTWKIGENWYGYTVSGVLPFAHVERAFENALRNQAREREGR